MSFRKNNKSEVESESLYTDDKIEFELIDLVGESSLSFVYKATNLGDGKNLAVKIFKSDLELLYPDSLVHSLARSKESSLEDTVDELRKKTFKNSTFVEYYEYQFNQDSEEHMILMEPISLMTLNELVEWYGYLDENTISHICMQVMYGLESLFRISYFHGNLSINNVFVDQNTMTIKMADYGLYNCIYTENPLETFEGLKMDLFWLGIIILKLLGKVRLTMPLDLGLLQYKVPILKQLYKNDSISANLKHFLDTVLEANTDFTRVWVHPFLSPKSMWKDR